MKKILLIIMLLASSMAWGQEYGKTIDPKTGFNSRLKEASDKINTIICDFTQTRRMAMIAKENSSKGKFYYKKSSDICLDYTVPEGNMIVMNSEKFKISTAGKTNIISNKSNPMMRQMNGMLTACLTGDLNLLSKESEVNYYESEKAFTVVVKPLNKRAKSYMQQIVLCFDKKDMTLISMRICESDTDYSLYEFRNKVFNSAVSDETFKI
ncbi:MAG: outer membrane lipoprotein carrier protein LolA [Rikenellaceae bacterium]